MDKSKPKTIIISILDHYKKEEFPILILEKKVSIHTIKEVNVTMIDANAKCAICKPKKA